ncbi:MAG: hypothetical protein ACI9H6_000551 [Patiriisocius sp.]|jgi:hypothetical protein
MYYYIFGALLIMVGVWTIGSYLVIKNLEEPDYSVIEKKNGYEIRQYAPYIIAETEVSGNYSETLNQGFGVIADYIFGNNTSKTSIAMTAPVLQNESEKIAMTVPVINTLQDEQTRTVSFVLPSKYTLETLPEPNNDKVTLTEVPARTVAALRFTWYASEERVSKKQELLLQKLSDDNYTVNGSIQVAQYNPPLSMPAIRRNEIIVPITNEVLE